MTKEEEVVVEKNWGLEVHGVLAKVRYETQEEAVEAIAAWKNRGWEFVNETYISPDP